MSRARLLAASILFGALGGVACRGSGNGTEAAAGGASEVVSAAECEAVESDPASLGRVTALAGGHRLVLVAERGPAAGTAVSGELRLVANDSAGAPLRGWTDARVTELGATVPGDPASRDPEAPGILVLVGPTPAGAGAPPSVTIRLGSHANRQGPARFDGAYAALYVRAIGSGSFAGRWASGAEGADVEGRFCAGRLPPGAGG